MPKWKPKSPWGRLKTLKWFKNFSGGPPGATNDFSVISDPLLSAQSALLWPTWRPRGPRRPPESHLGPPGGRNSTSGGSKNIDFSSSRETISHAGRTTVFLHLSRPLARKWFPGGPIWVLKVVSPLRPLRALLHLPRALVRLVRLFWAAPEASQQHVRQSSLPTFFISKHSFFGGGPVAWGLFSKRALQKDEGQACGRNPSPL